MKLLTKEEQITLIHNGEILAVILENLAKSVKPGLSELEIEETARKLIDKAGGKPAFLNYPSGKNLYPSATCVSVNDQIVHSPPTRYRFKLGDLVSVDLGFVKNGLYTDACFSLLLKDDDEQFGQDSKLVYTTRRALKKAIAVAGPGRYTGDIGYIINQTAEKAGFKTIKSLTGHGIGRQLHQDPSIYNFGDRKTGFKLKPGMAIAIEPIITTGSGKTKINKENFYDQFTIYTADGSNSAHFEDTILITETGNKVLTKQIFCDNVIKDIK